MSGIVRRPPPFLKGTVYNTKPVFAKPHLRAGVSPIQKFEKKVKTGPKIARIDRGVCISPPLPSPIEAWVTDVTNKQLEIIQLPQEVFGQPVRIDILHRVVEWQRANRRKDSQAVKTRADVRGGGRKPRAQKGSGRARIGSTRSPICRGGGKSHGPVKRSFGYPLMRKLRHLAMKVVLSTKFQEGNLKIWDKAVLSEPKTAAAVEMMKKCSLKSVFVINNHPWDRNFVLGIRNIQKVMMLDPTWANVYDIMKHTTLVITKQSIPLLCRRLILEKKKIPKIPKKLIAARQYPKEERRNELAEWAIKEREEYRKKKQEELARVEASVAI